jgi:putative flippase GtrA
VNITGARWPSRALLLEWLRFVAVGCLNTAVGYGLYALCIWLGAGYVAAAFLSMVGGVLFNYRTTGALVFSGRKGSLARFAGCYGLVLAFSVAVLGHLDRQGFDPYVAGLIAGVPAAALSFLLLRIFAFRPVRRA